MALTRATDKIIANADGNLNLSGIVTAANFVGGGAGLTGLNVDASALKSGSDIKAQANPHGVVVTGVLTATSYSGDGSNLTNLPAGLGTALSSDQTSPLNKLYYTNEILSIASTITVDHPATGTGAYTQYADLRLEEDADLIIADGDDVIPNILGLGTDGGGLGAGGSGRIRVDQITNKNANGAPNFTNGLTATTGTFSGNLGVGGVLTYEDVTNIDSVGLITARAGINLVGNDLNVGSNIKIGNASGIVTATSFRGGSLEITDGTTSVNKHSVGIGTTTTAGRNAGVSTSTGTIIYNSTLGKVQVYVENEWKNVKLQVAPLLLNYLVIGGGGAGGGNFRGGGGGAGAYRTNWNNENQGGGQSSGASVSLNTGIAYSVVIGAGGAGVAGSGNNVGAGNDGAQSKFDTITADGGGGGGHYNAVAGRNSPGNGSGGGGGSPNASGGSSGTYGYDAGNGGGVQCGGGGGGAASAGVNGGNGGTSGDGGTALASTITGSSVLRAGGGGGGAYDQGNNFPIGGGGGAGNGYYGSDPYQGTGHAATANTGSGGGGVSGPENGVGGAGGSGVVILRYPNDYTATYTGGVTKTSSTVGSDIVDIITATSNSSQTVTFAEA